MPTNLKLITPDDADVIHARFAESLKPLGYSCVVEIGPEYDSDHYRVVVSTNVPNDKIAEVFLKHVLPLEPVLEAELGSACWNFEAICKCGNKATAYVYARDEGESADYANCECRDCHSDEFTKNYVNICRRCGKQYNQYEDESWHNRLEAYVCRGDLEGKTEEERERIGKLPWPEEHNKAKEELTRSKAEIYEIGHNIHITPMNQQEFCCRECAKADFRDWLQRVLNHPFTKECLNG
jgi:hypothetical protein